MSWGIRKYRNHSIWKSEESSAEFQLGRSAFSFPACFCFLGPSIAALSDRYISSIAVFHYLHNEFHFEYSALCILEKLCIYYIYQLGKCHISNRNWYYLKWLRHGLITFVSFAAKKWNIYSWRVHDKKRRLACGKAYNNCRWRYLSCSISISDCLVPFVFFLFWCLNRVSTALEALVEHRITGFPVIDDDWKIVSFSYSS